MFIHCNEFHEDKKFLGKSKLNGRNHKAFEKNCRNIRGEDLGLG